MLTSITKSNPHRAELFGRMGIVVLFLVLLGLICLLAVFFVCYQSQQRSQAQASIDRQQTAAAVIYSRPTYPTGVSYPSGHRLYNRKAPTPLTIISNLPIVKYDARQFTSEDDEPAQCCICCCEYEQDDKVKLLPCLHKYHEECIDAWLMRDHICPICQADVVLAAGLSVSDWSQHTLDSINTISGTPTSPQPPSSAASPAAGVAEPSTPTARPHHAGLRPETPAAAGSLELQQREQQATSSAAAAAEAAARAGTAGTSAGAPVLPLPSMQAAASSAQPEIEQIQQQQWHAGSYSSNPAAAPPAGGGSHADGGSYIVARSSVARPADVCAGADGGNSDAAHIVLTIQSASLQAAGSSR